ncbi:MAG: hypothetical protein QOF30_1695 [Acidimicrobiaceae bacterium]|jgi:hypothetical protein|nr:hypothetical protein [Acidimicrobiaceae bacterium]
MSTINAEMATHFVASATRGPQHLTDALRARTQNWVTIAPPEAKQS